MSISMGRLGPMFLFVWPHGLLHLMSLNCPRACLYEPCSSKPGANKAPGFELHNPRLDNELLALVAPTAKPRQAMKPDESSSYHPQVTVTKEITARR